MSALKTTAWEASLKVNYEKTKALWIGSYKDGAFTMPYSKAITWAEGKVHATFQLQK